eukprot:scaffold11417_cov78-Skeletonema_marinoi.AAC.1
MALRFTSGSSVRRSTSSRLVKLLAVLLFLTLVTIQFSLVARLSKLSELDDPPRLHGGSKQIRHDGNKDTQSADRGAKDNTSVPQDEERLITPSTSD